MSVLDLFSLEGDVAVVTGSGTGIGRGITRGLAEAGASVVLTAAKQRWWRKWRQTFAGRAEEHSQSAEI